MKMGRASPLYYLIAFLSTLPVSHGSDCQPVSRITIEQFTQALVLNSIPVPANVDEHYSVLISNAKEGSITRRKEFAMFLSQVLHETVGLRVLSETCNYARRCQHKPQWQTICGRENSDYLSCIIEPNSGKKYCGPCNPCACSAPYIGRGYLHISTKETYKTVSEELFDNDDLFENPEMASANLTVAARVAFWLWKTSVRPKLCGDDFGQSSRAINSRDRKTKEIRYNIYKNVLTAFGIDDPPCGGKFTFGVKGPYCSSKRYLLVLDISGSMYEYGKIKRLHNAASLFIESLTRGAEVGVVAFSGTASIRSYLTFIQSNERHVNISSSEKLALISSIRNMRPTGSTCISCGVLTGLELLQGRAVCDGNTEMLLLTDGVHNTGGDDWVVDSLPQVKAAGVIVHTIAVGAEADDKLTMFAMATGGVTSSTQSQSTTLSVTFDNILAVSECDSHVKPQSVKPATLSPGIPTVVPIDVDEGIALNRPIKVTIDYDSLESRPAKVKLIPPDEHFHHDSSSDDIVYKIARSKRQTSELDAESQWWPDYNLEFIDDDDHGSGEDSSGNDTHSPHLPLTPSCEDNPEVQRMTCTFVAHSPGRWILRLESSSPIGNSSTSNSTYLVTLAAEANESFPIALSGHVATAEVVGTIQNITARFLAKGKPILNAVVEAKIESVVDNLAWTVPLYDDGLYPDEEACDGIYGGVFKDIVVKGDYSIAINGYDSSSASPDDYDLISSNNEKPVTAYQIGAGDFKALRYLYRTSTLGSFHVVTPPEAATSTVDYDDRDNKTDHSIAIRKRIICPTNIAVEIAAEQDIDQLTSPADYESMMETTPEIIITSTPEPVEPVVVEMTTNTAGVGNDGSSLIPHKLIILVLLAPIIIVVRRR